VDDESYIGVLIIEKSVYLKPVGYATQDNSLGIPTFLRAMFRCGCTKVAIDLENCRGMDSTFLGVMADAATNLPKHGETSLVILNASDKNKQELATVGLLPLVKIVEKPYHPPAGLDLQKVDFFHLPDSDTERIKEIKRLHEQLVNLNEKNKEQFGSFISMLEEELQETKASDENAG